MLDDERLAELRERRLSYIVGARLPNVKLTLVKNINAALNGKNGEMARFPSRHGDLVCDFSIKRYKKELIELNKLIQKAEELVEKQDLKVRIRFIRKVSKEEIELNTELIEKRRLLLGIKGYCTDLPKQLLSNKLVIERYHQLWLVEQATRMSKFDLQARPIIQQKHDAIKAHILICFVDLMAEKYLELTTRLSLREIRYLVWEITETHIQDTLTKEIFSFRSTTKEILNSGLSPLISKWKLLPHLLRSISFEFSNFLLDGQQSMN